ncbi:MAG: conjugative transposon protein TraK [Paludibacteraceae bacterium]|mgnify:FL=1|nr:conjugative transposon protein TraK [Paludibacteraceae bacterium]MCQ2191017.1 conjugative transposon protein TraK [Paludibacteraceae bacterium]
MEFKNLINIESAFKLSKGITFATIAMCAIISCSAIFMSLQYAEEQRQKIYVLDNGKSLILALQQDVQMNREAEIKSHVKRFHELFFTLTPNQEAIDYNINQALYLADNSVLEFYKNQQEKGFYKSLIGSNVIGDIRVDSVIVKTDCYPYKAIMYGKTSYMRTSSITYFSLITTQTLVNVQRYDNNPHGLMIENWKVELNEQIGEPRKR